MDMRSPLEDWELAGPRASNVSGGRTGGLLVGGGHQQSFRRRAGWLRAAAVEVTVSGPPAAGSPGHGRPLACRHGAARARGPRRPWRRTATSA